MANVGAFVIYRDIDWVSGGVGFIYVRHDDGQSPFVVPNAFFR